MIYSTDSAQEKSSACVVRVHNIELRDLLVAVSYNAQLRPIILSWPILMSFYIKWLSLWRRPSYISLTSRHELSLAIIY